MAWTEKVRQAQAQLVDDHVDPWQRILERAVPANVTSISSFALLDLLDVPPTTGNARRLAHTMRALGWIGLKSRRLAPGGWRTSTCRGWARALREFKSLPTMKRTGVAGVKPKGGPHGLFS